MFSSVQSEDAVVSQKRSIKGEVSMVVQYHFPSHPLFKLDMHCPEDFCTVCMYFLFENVEETEHWGTPKMKFAF